MFRMSFLKHRVDSFQDRPITLLELAEIIGPRRGETGQGRSTLDNILRWMRRGVYGVRLETWVALSTRITTLRKYQEFRRAAARARKKCARNLCRYLQDRRQAVN